MTTAVASVGRTKRTYLQLTNLFALCSLFLSCLVFLFFLFLLALAWHDKYDTTARVCRRSGRPAAEHGHPPARRARRSGWRWRRRRRRRRRPAAGAVAPWGGVEEGVFRRRVAHPPVRPSCDATDEIAGILCLLLRCSQSVGRENAVFCVKFSSFFFFFFWYCMYVQHTFFRVSSRVTTGVVLG